MLWLKFNIADLKSWERALYLKWVGWKKWVLIAMDVICAALKWKEHWENKSFSVDLLTLKSDEWTYLAENLIVCFKCFGFPNFSVKPKRKSSDVPYLCVSEKLNTWNLDWHCFPIWQLSWVTIWNYPPRYCIQPLLKEHSYEASNFCYSLGL